MLFLRVFVQTFATYLTTDGPFKETHLDAYFSKKPESINTGENTEKFADKL